jgi:hypothetical protein
MVLLYLLSAVFAPGFPRYQPGSISAATAIVQIMVRIARRLVGLVVHCVVPPSLMQRICV